jgi:acid phosphatase type 7
MPTFRSFRHQSITWVLAACALACPPPVRLTPPSAKASAEEVALSGAAVLLGAGDIATCPSQGDEGTAAIVDSILKADSVAGVRDQVFTTGDNVYPTGRTQDFANCFAKSWGSSTRRIMREIRPVPGNHEYDTEGAAPYYAYFGDKAGSPDKGYYTYKLGEWRIYAINSEIVVNSRFTLQQRKAQEDWLRKDLADNPTKCALAYWHHPRFSSSYHGSEALMQPLFQILYEGHAELVLSGHDHTYERFAPQTVAGIRDTLRGVTQIVVGTGGADLRGFRTPSANSVARVEGRWGILKLTLGAGGYQHAFLDTEGRIWDPGKGTCH